MRTNVKPAVLSGSQVDYLDSIADQVQAFVSHLVRDSGLPSEVWPDAESVSILGFCRRFVTLPVDCSRRAEPGEKLPKIVKSAARRAVQSAARELSIQFNRECDCMNTARTIEAIRDADRPRDCSWMDESLDYESEYC